MCQLFSTYILNWPNVAVADRLIAVVLKPSPLQPGSIMVLFYVRPIYR